MKSVHWEAKWIWVDDKKNQKNCWACFRREFDYSRGAVGSERVVLNITSDSRYIVYVNKIKIGFGPPRFWPGEQFYDTYDISDCLENGRNVICILAVHFGISTFQYIEGRAGVIAQLDFYNEEAVYKSIITDREWKSRINSAYIKNAARIIFQMAWSEIYNSNLFDADWTEINYNDAGWGSSTEIGDYGCQPWGGLIPRDISYLTEEMVYPLKVLSLKQVEPVRQHRSVNLRFMLFPCGYKDENREYKCYLSTILISPGKQKGFIMLNIGEGTGDFKVNDVLYKAVIGNVRFEIELNKGENLFIMDINGTYLDPVINICFDYEDEIKLEAPFFRDSAEFAVINRLADTAENPYTVDIDIQNIGMEGLSGFKKIAVPVSADYICKEVVNILFNRKRVIKEYPVDLQLQNIVIPDNSYALISPFDAGDTEIIMDFGKEYSGFVEFDLYAEKDAIIDLYMFEFMNNMGYEDTLDLNNGLRYVAREGRQKYTSCIRRGMRYLSVTLRNFTSPVKLYNVRFIQSNYPVAEIGKFECSDYKLNKIWEISKHTVKLCMEDTFVDCPAYEQAFWIGDSRNEALIGYYLYGNNDIVKHCLNLAGGSVKYNEFLDSVGPTGFHVMILTWTLLWLGACREYYDHSNDLIFTEGIYHTGMKVINTFLQHINKDGLLQVKDGNNMLDWSQPPMDLPGNGVETHLNAEFVKVLRDWAYISEVLGKEEEKNFLSSQAEKIKNSVNEYLWDESENAFIDSIHPDGEKSCVFSMQTNIMAYLCGCVREDRVNAVENLLLNCPDGYIKIGSPFMSFFYIEALARANKIEAAIKYISDKWGMMVDAGATTCWETFPGFEPGRLTRSHCHAWSAAPGYFLPRLILGVKLIKPGFEEILLEPYTCGLEWARGTVPVIDGAIDVEWKYDERKFILFVKLPEKVKIKVKLPDGIREEDAVVNIIKV